MISGTVIMWINKLAHIRFSRASYISMAFRSAMQAIKENSLLARTSSYQRIGACDKPLRRT